MPRPPNAAPARRPVATQRRVTAAILLLTLVLLGFTLTDLALGGRADPPALRAAAALLDGPWRFRTGDNRTWAEAHIDDTSWETIDLTPAPGSHDGDVGLPDYVDGWEAHDHPGYTGYAWYRRAVNVPTGPGPWCILGPALVEDGYELYWNGHLLGGSGRIGANPRLVGTRPLRFTLPPDAAGTRGMLAIRVFELTRAVPGTKGGGLHAPPILARGAVADGLHDAHWSRTLAGYIADAVEPLAMLLLALLALWCAPQNKALGFLKFAALALTLTAARRLNNAIVSWTDFMDLRTYSFLASYMWMPTVAAWTFAWNRWSRIASPIVDVLAFAIMIAQILAAATGAPTNVVAAARVGSIAILFVIGTRVARDGPMRSLAIAALVLVILVCFGGELLDPLGVPGIWFPFGIGVSRTQYLLAALVPLLGVLMARTLPVK